MLSGELRQQGQIVQIQTLNDYYRVDPQKLLDISSLIKVDKPGR